MRQAGLLAACGLVALEQSIDRLAEDHANARRLAKGLYRIDRSFVDPNEVETNIVMVDISKTRATAQRWAEVLAGQGVLASPATTSILRLVTHRHVSEADVDRALVIFRDIHTSELFAA